MLSVAPVAQVPPVDWGAHPVPTSPHDDTQWTWKGRLIQGVVFVGVAALYGGAAFASNPVCPAP